MMSLSNTGRDRLLLSLLLLSVAVLAALAWWQTQPELNTGKTLYDVAFADEKPDALESIELRLPGQPPISLKPEGDSWHIIAPVQRKARTLQVQQIITLLAEGIQAEYPAGGKELTAFGLADRAIAVSFNQQEFLLGIRNPTNQLRYVLYKEHILMVNEVVYELLRQGLDGLKDD